jgi:hypothetical protein
LPMPSFEYQKMSLAEMEKLGSAFCKEHGDNAVGIIADAEFDRLFDHLAEVLRGYGTFVEGVGPGDFSGYRYVDQVPWITIVPQGKVPLRAVLEAALKAVSTSHRPLAVAFDYYPNELLVLPPNRVFTTFERAAFD